MYKANQFITIIIKRYHWTSPGSNTPTKHQLYGHLPPITKTIQVKWTRHAGHCWRSRDVLISDVLLWTPTYGRAKAGRPARTYIQQLCGDMGCSPEDLPEAMNDREKWRERVRDIRAHGTTWWWFLSAISAITKALKCEKYTSTIDDNYEKTLKFRIRILKILLKVIMIIILWINIAKLCCFEGFKSCYSQ